MDEIRFKDNLVRLWKGGIPPMPVKPANIDRIRAVRDIIRRKYKLSLTEAEFTTCALFGFMSPDDAREACYSAEFDDELEAPDEQCPPGHVFKRRREQADTLVTLLEINRAVAKDIVSRVRPTAVNWKPSLRKQSSPFNRQPTPTT